MNNILTVQLFRDTLRCTQVSCDTLRCTQVSCDLSHAFHCYLIVSFTTSMYVPFSGTLQSYSMWVSGVPQRAWLFSASAYSLHCRVSFSSGRPCSCQPKNNVRQRLTLTRQKPDLGAVVCQHQLTRSRQQFAWDKNNFIYISGKELY